MSWADAGPEVSCSKMDYYEGVRRDWNPSHTF